MKINIISFTQAGAKIGARISKELIERGHQCRGYAKGTFPQKEGMIPLKESLQQWTKQAFEEQDALIFIGATGIAVRTIAPHLKSKTTDPAVLAIDEHGQYVISLISGHIGGANKLAEEVSEFLGAVPIVTTATDLNLKFAVDSWAAEKNLYIKDMKQAKQVSADLLQGNPVGFGSMFPASGELPGGLTWGKAGTNIDISIKEDGTNPHTLLLVPRIVVLGIGCRRGIEKAAVANLVDDVLKRERIAKEAVEKVVSIDLKAEEEGLVSFCKERGWPLQCFGGDELAGVKGNFTKSVFVESITGVDNVCERAAVLGSDGGKLIVKKSALNGVTVAIALKKYRIEF